jgi:hypothetical protein
MNNTLSVRSCSAYEHLEPPAGSKEYARGLDLLQPAADRLNALLGPNPPLDTADVVRIASMCGFDTTLRADTGWSKWCRVLSRDEWEAAGYLADMARWYRVGEGSAFGHIMGAGWVNELLARLRDRVPEDTTTVNRTLDGNPRTFPRGGNRLFVDFTHDNEMVEIMTALGVRKLRTKLPTSHIPTDEHTRNRFVLADLVPFGARWAVERVVCTMSEEDEERQGEPEGEQLHHSYAYPTKLRRPHRPKQPAKDRTYVRVLIK